MKPNHTRHNNNQDPASQGVIVSRLLERLSELARPPRLLREAVLPPVLAAAGASPSLYLHAAPLIMKARQAQGKGEGRRGEGCTAV